MKPVMAKGTLTRRKAITAVEPITAAMSITATKPILAMEPITVTKPITAMKLLILAMKSIIMVEPTMVPGPSNIDVAMKPVTVSKITETTFTMVEAFTGMEVATMQTFRAGCLPHL